MKKQDSIQVDIQDKKMKKPTQKVVKAYAVVHGYHKRPLINSLSGIYSIYVTKKDAIQSFESSFEEIVPVEIHYKI